MSQAFREPASSPDAPRAVEQTRTPAGTESIDIPRIVRTRWRLFRNVCLSVVGVAVLAVLIIPPHYSASAVIMLEPRKNNVTDQSAVLSEMPTDPASVQNQMQLLTSRDLAARVVESQGLDHDPEFAGTSFGPFHWSDAGPAADPQARFDSAVTAFLKHLSVDAVGLSTTITVTFTSRDPGKAARIADAIVDTYLETQAAIRFDAAERTSDWLLGRIRQLGQEAQASDAAVQRYKAEHNLNDTPAGGSLVDQQLMAINEQLVTARADLAAKEAQSARISSLVSAGRAADVSEVVSSPLIIQLREQEADDIRLLSQLSSRYGPQDPKLIAAQSQKRDLDAKIGEEVDRLAGSMQNEVLVARAQVHSLEQSLQNGETEASGQNMARVKLLSLESAAASTRSIYESFVSRLREMQGQDGLETVDAREISHAAVPNAPSWPPRLAILAASLPIGLLLALLAVLLAEKYAGPVVQSDLRKEPARVAKPIDPLRVVPVLAELSGAQRAAELAIEQPMSACSQSLRALAQRIGAQHAKVVVVTSLDPREGQTGVSVGLARAASQLGAKVVLIDGNISVPATALRLGLGLPPAGLVEVLGGAVSVNRALQKDPRSNTYFLSGSARSANPGQVWASQAAHRLLQQFRQGSDLVIIDAVSLLPGNELPLIVRLADAVIVVAAASKGPHPGLSAALQYLQSVAPQPPGIVLTR